MRDEELAPSGVLAGQGHSQPSRIVEERVDFAADGIAGTAPSVCLRISPLDDEVGDNAVEGGPL